MAPKPAYLRIRFARVETYEVDVVVDEGVKVDELDDEKLDELLMSQVLTLSPWGAVLAQVAKPRFEVHSVEPLPEGSELHFRDGVASPRTLRSEVGEPLAAQWNRERYERVRAEIDADQTIGGERATAEDVLGAVRLDPRPHRAAQEALVGRRLTEAAERMRATRRREGDENPEPARVDDDCPF